VLDKLLTCIHKFMEYAVVLDQDESCLSILHCRLSGAICLNIALLVVSVIFLFDFFEYEFGLLCLKYEFEQRSSLCFRNICIRTTEM